MRVDIAPEWWDNKPREIRSPQTHKLLSADQNRGIGGNMRVLQLQLPVSAEKEENIARVRDRIERLKDQKADLVTLGEMFICPYETPLFPRYAEPEGGGTWQELSRIAKDYGIYLAAGTVPESDEAGRIYNTAYVFDRSGKQIAKHRKMHLFDINIEGGQSFRESATLTAGDQCTVFDTEFCRMGLCICFDIRFPELSRLMALQDAQVILVPAAFNMTTGPAHWELNFRSRALDNQCYYVATSDARDEGAGYVAWGHSLVTSPWGEIVAEMDEKEGYQITDLDLAKVQKVRRELPLLAARRTDLYEVRLKN